MNNQLNVSSFGSAVTKGLVLSWETNKSWEVLLPLVLTLL